MSQNIKLTRREGINASGEHSKQEAWSEVKGAALYGNSSTNRGWHKDRILLCKNSHLFQAPPPLTLAGSVTPDPMDQGPCWKDVSNEMQAPSRKVAQRLRRFCAGDLKRVSKGLTQKVLSKVLHKIHLKKDHQEETRLNSVLFCLAQVLLFHTQKHMYRLSTPYNASLKPSGSGYNFSQDQQGLFPQVILCVWEAFALNFTVSQSTNRCSAVKHELFKGNLHNNFPGWQAILNSS